MLFFLCKGTTCRKIANLHVCENHTKVIILSINLARLGTYTVYAWIVTLTYMDSPQGPGVVAVVTKITCIAQPIKAAFYMYMYYYTTIPPFFIFEGLVPSPDGPVLVASVSPVPVSLIYAQALDSYMGVTFYANTP